MSKLQSLLEDIEKAIARLSEVLALDKSDVVRDSAIKRFEIVFDLGWKTLKEFLEEDRTVRCVSPKRCFREAYKQELISYNDFWIDICDMRNKTAHVYDEKLADSIYRKLPEVLRCFEELLRTIKNELENKK